MTDKGEASRTGVLCFHHSHGEGPAGAVGSRKTEFIASAWTSRGEGQKGRGLEGKPILTKQMPTAEVSAVTQK